MKAGFWPNNGSLLLLKKKKKILLWILTGLERVGGGGACSTPLFY
jgi:hypothetical protein